MKKISAKKKRAQKVYLVSTGIYNEDKCTVGIFSTKRKAEKYMEKYPQNGHEQDAYNEIETYVIDKV